MPNYSINDVVLVRYPFSDVSRGKVRPAVVVSAPHTSQDVFIVPLTSRLTGLLDGEFVLENWKQAGLNVPSAIKRGIYTIHQRLIFRCVGQIPQPDRSKLVGSLKKWFGLT